MEAPAALTEIINTRLRPHLNEVFDGFVVMGYHTNGEGVRQKIAITGNACRDIAVYDGLQPAVHIASQWSQGKL